MAPIITHPPHRPLRGFSLIELSVVVAIIGILAAVAIPTFLVVRTSAQDRQAQAAIRNVAAAGRAAAAGAADALYPDVDTVQAAERAVVITEDPSTGPNIISVARSDDFLVFVLTSHSTSGTCWVMVTNLRAATTFGSFPAADDECVAAEIDPEDYSDIDGWG